MRFSVLMFAAAAFLPPRAPPPTATYVYTATTAGPALKQGAVAASGITWTCSGNACTVSGPWSTPGVAACHALAQHVGALASYGRPKAMLTASELATCNAGLPVAAAPRIKVLTASVTSVPPPYSVTTTAFTVTGTGALNVRPPFTPVTITAPAFTVTGTGALIVRPPFTPVTVTTPQFTVTGTGALR